MNGVMNVIQAELVKQVTSAASGMTIGNAYKEILVDKTKFV